MQYAIELTNFNVRVGPNASDGETFDVAVNCVCADHEIVIVKALSPGVKFTFAHKEAIKAALISLGFSAADWRTKRKDLGMNIKRKLPHPSECSTPEHHMAAIELGLEQAKSGHYKFSDISVTQTDLGNGKVQLNASCVREETNPDEVAA